VHIPTDNSLQSTWTTRDFIPETPAWSDGTTNSGVGYERSSGYENLIETDVESDMYNKEKSVLCRMEFDYDGREFEELLLYMKYDDGFVAYLNGPNEIARSSNVTNDTPGSAEAGNHEAGSSYTQFPIPNYQSLLVNGRNVLAIHGINGSLGSSDMLVLPMIIGKVIDESPPTGDIWFTVNGSDPRDPNGNINSDAINTNLTESLAFTESIPVKARTLDNDVWSALNVAIYLVGSPNLYINEFMASNTSTIEDPDEKGSYPDWVEIYNPMLIPFDMGGMYLTDNQTIPTKFQIPNGVSIDPGGYLLFWADKEPAQGQTHTNFKLNATYGEVIRLIDTDGTTVIDSIVFGPQTSDISYGRLVDGTENQGLLETPTPGTTNQGGI
jgi:hypothetical protein